MELGKEKEIRILELFSGYGTATFALNRLGLKHRCVGYSDIEKAANYIFPLNHGEDIPQLGDVNKINPDELEDFELLTGGFPCQSFSLAGKREGFGAKDKGNLFFEIIRIAKAKMPRYMLLENVEGIISHDDGYTLQRVLAELALAGYHVQWKKMYSRNHGTPQNRPRVWFACFRDEEDCNKFAFPEDEPLKTLVRDLLESDVPEKYYLSEKQIEKFYTTRKDGDKLADPEENTMFNVANTSRQGPGFKNNGVSFTLDASATSPLLIADFRNDKGPRIVEDVCYTLCSRKHSHNDISTSPPMIQVADFRNDEGLRIRADGVAPTLASCRNSETELSRMSPLVVVGGEHVNASIMKDMSPTITTKHPILIKEQPTIIDDGASEKFRSERSDGICPTLKSTRANYAMKVSPTLTTELAHSTGNTFNAELFKNLTGQWRRLTPRECFRLQGFFNDEIKFGELSDSKLYFLAGNGQDVNVVAKVFKQMFVGNDNKQKGIFDF